jgi:hypothetical protein
VVGAGPDSPLAVGLAPAAVAEAVAPLDAEEPPAVDPVHPVSALTATAAAATTSVSALVPAARGTVPPVGRRRVRLVAADQETTSC